MAVVCDILPDIKPTENVKNDFFLDNNLLQNRSLLILDFDDTLFPTSYLSKSKSNSTSNNIEDLTLFDLEKKLLSFLNSALKYCDILIVTNAEKAWVDLKLEEMKDLQNFINNHTKVISAREYFQENKFNSILNQDNNGDKDNGSEFWKSTTFFYYIYAFTQQYNYEFYNIISIGDSEYERTALQFCERTINDNHIYSKSIKLLNHPSIEYIYHQFSFLDSYLPQLISHHGSLDLMLTAEMI